MDAAALLVGVVDRLVERFAAGRHEAEAAAARADWYDRRGKVHEDEPLWEAWTQGFLEWFVLERPLAGAGRPPAAVALARDPDTAATLRACLGSHRSLFEVRALAPGRIELDDLLGGARFAVAERRALPGVGRGDVLEARLFGLAGEVCFGRAFCFHPTGTRDAILGRLAGRPGGAAARLAALDELAELRVRCEHYRHVPPVRVYEAAESAPAVTART
jgi:hypothetical protein